MILEMSIRISNQKYQQVIWATILLIIIRQAEVSCYFNIVLWSTHSFPFLLKRKCASWISWMFEGAENMYKVLSSFRQFRGKKCSYWIWNRKFNGLSLSRTHSGICNGPFFGDSLNFTCSSTTSMHSTFLWTLLVCFNINQSSRSVTRYSECSTWLTV